MGQKQSKPNQFHRSRSARQVIHTENIMFEDDALTNKNDLNISVFSRRQKKHKSIKLKEKNQNDLFQGLPTLGDSMAERSGHDSMALTAAGEKLYQSMAQVGEKAKQCPFCDRKYTKMIMFKTKTRRCDCCD